MFFTARKPKSRKNNGSNSKESRDSNISASIKSKPVLAIISTAELRLREAINRKFEKSHINNFKYQCTSEGWEDPPKSPKSSDMEEYQNLKGRRFVNIKDYHGRKTEQNNCKYLIRKRQADQQKLRSSSQAEALSPVCSNDPFKKK